MLIPIWRTRLYNLGLYLVAVDCSRACQRTKYVAVAEAVKNASCNNDIAICPNGRIRHGGNDDGAIAVLSGPLRRSGGGGLCAHVAEL